MLETGLTCIPYLISLVSIGFLVPCRHLLPFQSYGFHDLFIPFLEKPLNTQVPIRFSQTKMASSQVEMASSAPFGCILRDQNRGDRFTNTFQNSLKDYLLQTCIPNSSPAENSLNSGSWVRNANNDDNNNEVLSPNSKKQVRVLERWARARDMIASIESPNREQRGNPSTQSNTSLKIPNPGGVSSLVQRWRGISETLSNQNPKSNNNNHATASSPIIFNAKSNSENVPPPNNMDQEGNISSNRSEAFDELVDERFDTPSMMTEDSFMDWESERTAISGSPSVTDGGESERVRVADVIRKLTSENQMQGCLVSWKNEQHGIGSSVSSCSASPYPCDQPSLPRLQTAVSDPVGEGRGCFSSSSPVVSSPRLRGRQAFNDLLMQLERDRHRELDGLVERRAVSKFSHRGRIQSLLRLRFLRREADARYDHNRQNLRRETGAQQQHSNSGVVEAAQRRSHCEVAVEAPRHSFAMEVRPQQISCHGGDNNAEKSLGHEGVGAQQRFEGREEATVGSSQHLISVANGFQQHSHPEASIGNHLHLFSKEGRDLETAKGEAVVEVRQQPFSASLEASRTRQPSAVVLLREKFDIRIENDAATPKTPRGVVVNNNADMKNSSSSNQVMKESQPHDQNLESCSMENIHKEASPSSDTQREGTTSNEDCNIELKEYAAMPLTASNGWEEDVSAEEQEAHNLEQTTTNEDMMNDDWQEQESNDQQLVGTVQDWISDISRPWSEWDEQEANGQQIVETNCDWTMDISRPRSDWEGLREARYQEMLDPYLDNGDIRQLLERRSVSTFLSSNLRETMDRLMISRAERLPQSVGDEQEEEDGFRNRLQQLMLSRMHTQAHMESNHREDCEQDMEDNQEDEEQDMEEDQEDDDDEQQEEDNQEEEEDDDDDDEDEEEESPITRQYSEVGEYVDQVADGLRTWSHDGGHEVNDDSDQVASQSSQQSQSSQASYQGARFRSSFTNHSSIEMELVYDLRGHMLQLQHEMSKLRKSLKSCVNMQSKLQRSIKHEVADAVSRSVRGVGNESLNEGPRKRSCCVCYEMQVDSLLYRCGHMCTCFKCAHELQWSSGKCPICRAPIVDVVRAYANDS